MSAIPTIVLALVALLNLGRGAFHALAPDSGAGSVAGLDLSTNGAAIIFLLASVGISQFVWGLLQAYIVLRERRYVLGVLALQALLTTLSLANMIWWKPPPVTVPGESFNMVVLGVLLVALIIGLIGTPKATRSA